MTAETLPESARLKAFVLRILDENRTMTIATVRPDGWPQATTVGYVRDDLTLYFVVSQRSQKLTNLRRDPRASIAIGHRRANGGVRGLSMAARVELVQSAREIERLNALVHGRYPGVAIFAPRQSLSATLRAQPELISLVDEDEGLREPLLLSVSTHADLAPVSPVEPTA